MVLVSLPTPAVVSAVALGDNGLLGGAALRAYVDLSTTGRTTARQVAATLAAAGVQAVDAPVSGGVPGAVNGTLTIMVAGRGPRPRPPPGLSSIRWRRRSFWWARRRGRLSRMAALNRAQSLRCQVRSAGAGSVVEGKPRWS